MRRLRALAALLALPLLVTACTGTSENVPPLLLAVGRVDATSGKPQMVLVEDGFNPAGGTPNPRLSVLESSARNVTYAPVAADVVDRTGSRSSVYVLTRDLAGGTDPASVLLRFNLAGIDPAAPSAFSQTAKIDLTGAPGDVLQSEAPACFTGLTVSRSGRYVTLLDDPGACGDTTRFPRLFQLDTQAGTFVPVVKAGVQNVLPATPFDDQAATDETLYLLQPGTTNAQVWTDPVPHDATLLQQATTLPSQDQLALRSDGTNLVAVTNGDRYNPTANGPSTLEAVNPVSLGSSTQVDTVPGARVLAVDPTGAQSEAVVAGYDQIALHKDATTKLASDATTPTSYDYTGVAAAIDPTEGFAYVVGNDRIVILDLLNFEAQRSWYPSPYYVPTLDLNLPTDATGRYVTALAWTRAAGPTP